VAETAAARITTTPPKVWKAEARIVKYQSMIPMEIVAVTTVNDARNTLADEDHQKSQNGKNVMTEGKGRMCVEER
jgi:hypothetical protein